MEIEIHPAVESETSAVSEVLCEAAAWLERRGIPLWNQAQLQPSAIQADVASGFYVLALDERRPAGAFKYQLEDPLVWPDVARYQLPVTHEA